MIRITAGHRMIFQLAEAGPRMLMRSREAPPAPFPVPLRTGFAETGPWRVYTVGHPGRDPFGEVVRPPLDTPTGRFLGDVGFQRLLREPPGMQVGNCVDDDFVCSSGRDFNAHTQYVETGMVDRAATFAAGKVLTAIPPEANAPQPSAAAPQPHLQSSPLTIASCTTECRVVGPE